MADFVVAAALCFILALTLAALLPKAAGVGAERLPMAWSGHPGWRWMPRTGLLSQVGFSIELNHVLLDHRDYDL